MDVDEPRLTNEAISALARRIDRPVVLVGMMGVGKSSVGRKLAATLRLPFVDADEAIEQAAHMPIPDIFATFGEAYFRDGERRVIARLLDGQSQERRSIIATGGGAFVYDQTRTLILEKAIPVWLDCDVETLYERVGRKGNRPLLKQGDPREILNRLKAEREPYYAQAPIKVMSGNGPQARTVDQVLRGIDAWL